MEKTSNKQKRCVLANLFVASRKWGHQLEDYNPTRSCSSSHQIIKTAEQFYSRDRVTFSLLDTETNQENYSALQKYSHSLKRFRFSQVTTTKFSVFYLAFDETDQHKLVLAFKEKKK